MMFVQIPYKYLGLISITFENIFAIETKHLINGEIFLNWVRDWGVKKPGTIKFWIDPGGTTHFATDLSHASCH